MIIIIIIIMMIIIIIIYGWYTSCLLVPIEYHLNYYGSIEAAQRDA